MTASEDVKPNISKVQMIVEFNGNQLTFLHKKNKPLGKVLETFCDKFNLDRKTLRFTFNGQRVRDQETAEGLKMDEDDDGDVPVIQGHIFQEGG
ncbi:hypothetical protein DFH06DRAFT_1196930 [Mycena polygramma]|nr:hypothetical protein DFH06DRAFT_1196930 [Mycena polygramma]